MQGGRAARHVGRAAPRALPPDTDALAFHVARQLSKPAAVEPKGLERRAISLGRAPIARAPAVGHPPNYELKALRQIHKQSFEANTLLEVRDATVPSSSHHPSFTRLARHRRHLIVYTHADVLDAAAVARVAEWTRRSWPAASCRFVDTREGRADPDAFADLQGWLEHELDDAGGRNCALTVGVPNVGKSSVLLALMRRRGVQPKMRVGQGRRTTSAKPSIHDKPGHTRELVEYVLRETSRAYCLDVPGISTPKELFEERPEALWALRAAGCLHDHALDDAVEADVGAVAFALRAMNRAGNVAYVAKLGLDGPTADAGEALAAIARARKLQKIDDERERTRAAAGRFLKLLRTGNFGPVVLDDISGSYSFFRFDGSHDSRSRGKVT